MTLALILFLGSLLTIPVPQSGQAATQPPTSSAQESAPPSQGATPSAQTPTSGTTTAPTQTPKSTTKKRRRHKKTATADCKTAPGPNTTSAGATTSTGDPANASAPQQTTNCPPSKVIVRQGGTKEPSIQLAGDQSTEQRNAINQMLGSSDVNLKKLADRQLSANQQDMVNQVRQFMQQSKSAMAGGDMERARTLAWKAQLLSEELANPGK